VGVPKELEVDMVIGADGANSRVAKEIGAGDYDYAIAFQARCVNIARLAPALTPHALRPLSLLHRAPEGCEAVSSDTRLAQARHASSMQYASAFFAAPR
jgi:2-polyprenyl-6-methoxyphenol hydroxylase-like FAD-dependent oxidoreductase